MKLSTDEVFALYVVRISAPLEGYRLAFRRSGRQVVFGLVYETRFAAVRAIHEHQKAALMDPGEDE